MANQAVHVAQGALLVVNCYLIEGYALCVVRCALTPLRVVCVCDRMINMCLSFCLLAVLVFLTAHGGRRAVGRGSDRDGEEREYHGVAVMWAGISLANFTLGGSFD